MVLNADSMTASYKNAADESFQAAAEAAVRINPVCSGLAEEDLAAVLSARRLPNALVVPKVESPDDIRWIFDRVQRLLSKQPPRRQHQGRSSSGAGGGPVHQAAMALVPMCESALALLNLRYYTI